jgi:hypothetical protein
VGLSKEEENGGASLTNHRLRIVSPLAVAVEDIVSKGIQARLPDIGILLKIPVR